MYETTHICSLETLPGKPAKQAASLFGCRIQQPFRRHFLWAAYHTESDKSLSAVESYQLPGWDIDHVEPNRLAMHDSLSGRLIQYETRQMCHQHIDRQQNRLTCRLVGQGLQSIDLQHVFRPK